MWIYRLLLALLMPYLLGRFVWRALSGQESWADVAERLGALPPKPTTAKTVWLHAASNGELASAKPLIQYLLECDTDLSVLVTFNSVTGRQLVQGWDLSRVTACLAPVDLRRNALQILKIWHPSAFITIENELWPNRLAACEKHAIPVALIGARLSQRSVSVWRKLGGARRLIGKAALLSAQDKASEDRFLSLGVPDNVLSPRLNLKALYAIDQTKLSDPAYPRTHMMLAASTHEGEDERVLHAFQRARKDWPKLRLILAPRHSSRAEEIVGLVESLGLTAARRSVGDIPNGQSDVFIADTMGEMDRWYHAAVLCFVGGSFVQVGGHTPFEPITHECAVLHGPYTANFTDTYAALEAISGSIKVTSAQDLGDAIIALRSASRRKDLVRQARTLVLNPQDIDAVGSHLRRLIKGGR